MSGSKLNNYSTLDNNITEMQLTEDASFVGLHTVSLTNYDTTGVPQIAAGSIVEVNGALYKFSSAETITGSPADGTVYIQIVPSGATCTAQYTNTVPTWSNAKQGFYGTGGAATYRYLEYQITKAGALYSDKKRISYDDNVIFDTVTSSNVYIGTLGVLSDASVLGNINLTGDLNITGVTVKDGANVLGFDIYGNNLRETATSVAVGGAGTGQSAHSIPGGAATSSKIVRMSVYSYGGSLTPKTLSVAGTITWDDTYIYVVGGTPLTTYYFRIIYND